MKLSDIDLLEFPPRLRALSLFACSGDDLAWLNRLLGRPRELDIIHCSDVGCLEILRSTSCT